MESRTLSDSVEQATEDAARHALAIRDVETALELAFAAEAMRQDQSLIDKLPGVTGTLPQP